jgi:hypothetical protein
MQAATLGITPKRGDEETRLRFMIAAILEIAHQRGVSGHQQFRRM